MERKKRARRLLQRPGLLAKGLLAAVFGEISERQRGLRYYLNKAPDVEWGNDLVDFTFAPWVRVWGVVGNPPLSAEFLMVTPCEISFTVKRASSSRKGQTLYRHFREIDLPMEDARGISIAERVYLALELALSQVMLAKNLEEGLSKSNVLALDSIWNSIGSDASSNKRWLLECLAKIKTLRRV